MPECRLPSPRREHALSRVDKGPSSGIREAPSSNLGRDIDWPNEIFRGFLRTLQENARIAWWIRTQSLSFNSLRVYYRHSIIENYKLMVIEWVGEWVRGWVQRSIGGHGYLRLDKSAHPLLKPVFNWMDLNVCHTIIIWLTRMKVRNETKMYFCFVKSVL
jgi:hypothetical protein